MDNEKEKEKEDSSKDEKKKEESDKDVDEGDKKSEKKMSGEKKAKMGSKEVVQYEETEEPHELDATDGTIKKTFPDVQVALTWTQSYKASTIVIYESRVVNMCNLLVTTTY